MQPSPVFYPLFCPFTCENLSLIKKVLEESFTEQEGSVSLCVANSLAHVGATDVEQAGYELRA